MEITPRITERWNRLPSLKEVASLQNLPSHCYHYGGIHSPYTTFFDDHCDTAVIANKVLASRDELLARINGMELEECVDEIKRVDKDFREIYDNVRDVLKYHEQLLHHLHELHHDLRKVLDEEMRRLHERKLKERKG